MHGFSRNVEKQTQFFNDFSFIRLVQFWSTLTNYLASEKNAFVMDQNHTVQSQHVVETRIMRICTSKH